MSGHSVGRTVIVHKDKFAYNAHPSIAVLDNGEWLVGFGSVPRREPRRHPPEDPLFRTLLTRSSDRGETWEEPFVAPDYGWAGVEPPGLSQLSDGSVVLTQFRFGWYPLGPAKKRRAAGGTIFIRLPGRRWTEEFTDDEWEKSEDPFARDDDGVYSHLSTDGGRTFGGTVKIDTGPYLDGFTRTGVVELADGRVAYAVTEHSGGGRTYLLVSSDGCVTWEPPALMVESEAGRFNEPHLAEVSNGEIYCVLRDGSARPQNFYQGYLHGCRSVDGGRTWSVPEPTAMMGLPGHLLVLDDGRLLCTYGCRHAPFGIRASLSEDGGRTWQVDPEIVIRDDLPNGWTTGGDTDLGYPTTIEYEPGRLFCCYYAQDSDGVTCIQGTYIDLGS